MYTSWSLSLRIIQRGSRFMFNASFLGQKWPICYEEKVFQESLSCTSLCLSFSITFKKSLEWIQNYDNTSFFRPKMTQLLWMKFFPRKIINIIFINFLASSIWKIEENKYFEGIQISMCHLCAQNDVFSWRNFFSDESLAQFSCLLTSFNFCEILRKSLKWIQSNENRLFFGPKWPDCLMWKSFPKNNKIFMYLLVCLIVDEWNKSLKGIFI